MSKKTIAGLETNVKNLKDLNSILESDIKELKTDKNTIKNTFEMLLAYIKEFFRTLLEIGSNTIKDKTANTIKEIYDEKIFNKHDVFDIAKETDKEKELFKYAEIPYWEVSTHSREQERNKSDDFEL